MIPTIDVLTEEITERVYHNKTYKVVVNKDETDETKPDRISGYTDDLDAIIQTIRLILSTERYKYLIYSWDYGVELVDLIGQPMPYVMSEIPRRITEALVQDDRIEDVKDFEFETNGKKLHVTFTVVSTIGNIPTELEVDV